MKGAKGLLISITGGRDMTLFEVDEAATRIREEVDQDANIILGATFDEELEGVIRVSVVATGIDKTAAEIAAPVQIRQQPKPVAKPELRPAAVSQQGTPAQQPVHRDPVEMHADPVAEAIRAAEAPLEAIQPRAVAGEEFRPHSKLFQAPPQQVRQQPVQQQAAVAQAPRMPRVEDFPPVARAEMAAQPVHEDHEDRGPMGLLKRLTTGLSRREEEPRLQPAQPREPKLREASVEPRRLQDPQLYAPRRGQLDEHGRLAPQPRAAHEDDQLEIPAFLRRQAN
jgi:cell division protein FtsZ